MPLYSLGSGPRSASCRINTTTSTSFRCLRTPLADWAFLELLLITSTGWDVIAFGVDQSMPMSLKIIPHESTWSFFSRHALLIVATTGRYVGTACACFGVFRPRVALPLLRAMIRTAGAVPILESLRFSSLHSLGLCVSDPMPTTSACCVPEELTKCCELD